MEVLFFVVVMSCFFYERPGVHVSGRLVEKVQRAGDFLGCEPVTFCGFSEFSGRFSENPSGVLDASYFPSDMGCRSRMVESIIVVNRLQVCSDSSLDTFNLG